MWIKDDSVWIQHGRIQDGCHHQVELEIMTEIFFVQMVGTNLGKCEWVWKSLSQIELVWVRVRVEWECFWVNLREDNKVSESKMTVSESNMREFKMAAIIKLSQNEWVKFLCGNGGNQSWQVWVSLKGKTKMAESKMAESKWQKSRWLPPSSWVRINEFESDWISLSQSQNGVRVFLSISERR